MSVLSEHGELCKCQGGRGGRSEGGGRGEGVPKFPNALCIKFFSLGKRHTLIKSTIHAIVHCKLMKRPQFKVVCTKDCGIIEGGRCTKDIQQNAAL